MGGAIPPCVTLHIMKGINLGNKNGMWVGDNVSYSKLHTWVRRHLVKPEFCDHCGAKPPHDVANKTGKYLRDLLDWEWLCRTCHMKSDGRLEALQNHNLAKKLAKTKCEKCGVLFQPKRKTSKYHNRDCWKRRNHV